jgi:hypothetical protein
MAVLMGVGVELAVGFGDDVDARRADAAVITVRHMLGLAVDGHVEGPAEVGVR